MLRSLLFIVLVSIAPVHAADLVLVGTVEKIVDGDTLDVKLASGVIRVRLHGIDTPERGQAHYKEATESLARLVNQKVAQLKPIGQPSFDRMVARVYVDDVDVNAAQLKAGMAYAETRFLWQVDDGDSYCEFEHEARSQKRGIWSYPWEDRIAPWEWRRRDRLDEFTDFADETAEDCIAALGDTRE
jgi:micrococcal nuclease